MKGVEVVIVIGSGWEGLYVNEKLETEGDSISLHDFVDLINKYKTFKSIETREISDECLDETASCPKNLEDVF